MKIIQMYAPTSTHNNDEVESFYEDISKAIQQDQEQCTILIGDFNAKLGHKLDDSELALGPHGYRERNDRGIMLLNFILPLKRVTSVSGLG